MPSTTEPPAQANKKRRRRPSFEHVQHIRILRVEICQSHYCYSCRRTAVVLHAQLTVMNCKWAEQVTVPLQRSKGIHSGTVRRSGCSKDFSVEPIFKYLRFRGNQLAIVMQTKELSCKKGAAFDVRLHSRVVSVAVLAFCQIRQINETVIRLNDGLVSAASFVGEQVAASVILQSLFFS